VSQAQYGVLHFAAASGFVTVLQALIAAKADLDQPGAKGDRALFLAAGSGHSEVVKCLIEAKAALDAVDYVSQLLTSMSLTLCQIRCTPLHFAAYKNQCHVMRVLLAAKAATDACDMVP